MYFFFSLIPATFALALGYFILFSSSKAQGAVKVLGRILALWLFVLAAIFPAAGGYVTYSGLSPVGSMMRSMHSGASFRN